jgi:hypothetical protein
LFHSPEERVSKSSGKSYVSATLKTRNGDDTQFIRLLAFSSTAQTELSRLVDGEALAVQGDLKAEAYEKDCELRVSLTVMVSAVWPIQHKPERQERNSGKKPAEPPPFDDDIGF